MKICIMCESTLLQKALEYYLTEFLAPYQDAEFIISDITLNINKPVCLINSTQHSAIKKPFTPISLVKDLQDFYHTQVKKSTLSSSNATPASLLDIKDPKLQTKIDHILQEFSKQIYQTLNNDKNNPQ